MIAKIIEFSAKNKFFVILCTVVACLGAWQAVRLMPLDAIPDLSDTQVIIYSRWDRSPDVIEDQVTYPIVTALLGAPHVKAIRASTDFGYSYIYVIFSEGTDIYWARSRVVEYLSKITPSLPQGVRTELGPDATGVGWVYQYALIDKTGQNDLSQLRSYQDWSLRYQLQAVPGVAEVATFGGFHFQYQIHVDPDKLRTYGITISEVIDQIRASNNQTGGRTLEISGFEFMVRGNGYIKSKEDIETIVLRADANGTPVLVKNIADVTAAGDMRRGLSDLDGEGDSVGGVVVMRSGENALRVIEQVKQKIRQIEPTLPKGMQIVQTYDRSDLILKAISTLKRQLIEEMIIVSLVILVFLWHFPSAVVPIITIPIAVLLSFIPMFFFGMTSNIMSLAGIAISIGVLVDGAIIEVENAYKKLEHWHSEGRKGDYHQVRLDALKEVGPSVFFSLLVVAVAFLPIFALVDQAGRLFKPLALSKTFAMMIAAGLALTLDPALRMLFTRADGFSFKPVWARRIADTLLVGHYRPEEKHPISRRLFKIYEPVTRFCLKHPRRIIASAVLIFLLSVPFYFKLGSEFMPPLNEGVILYMPMTPPGISVTEAQKLLQLQDKILKTFPEVERVHGKAGRAETSTDPAPLSMMETVVVLKPQNQWRKVSRWYSKMPEWMQEPFRHVWPDRIRYEDLVNEMDQKLRLPGVSNAWTMPIKNRIDMLSTGMRTPVGVKIFGPDLNEIERIGLEIENTLKPLKGVRSAFSERAAGGYFVDVDFDRQALARYGITMEDAQKTFSAAVGGEEVTTLINGRERHPILVRYARDFREDVESLKKVLIPTSLGAQIPLAEVADVHLTQGPSMIRDENGQLAGYVYIDVAARDIGGFVHEAKEVVKKSVTLPAGYTVTWSGQYENMLSVRDRLRVILPVTFFVIVLLLFFNTKSWVKTGIVLLSVPFSLVGAILFMYALGYHLSVASWVGMIALMGLDAEMAVFMLLYLDLSYNDAVKAGKMNSRQDLEEAVVHGAVRRIRPKMMTVLAAMLGLLPILWSMGTGADVMKRIAAPMIGGLVTSFIMELLVYPPIYFLWKGKKLKGK